MDTDFLTQYLGVLKEEHGRRQIEGESEDDIIQAKTRAHYMASFETNPHMDTLLEKTILKVNEVFQASWQQCNRQIIYRTDQNEVDPCGYHIDGCFGIFSKQWEETWPGFQILAGIPLMEAGSGQGGLWVKPGSHEKAIEVYKAEGDHLKGLVALQEWEKEQKNVMDGEMLHLTPGDLILLHSLLLHMPDPLNAPYEKDVKVYFRLMDRPIVGRHALGEVLSF